MALNSSSLEKANPMIEKGIRVLIVDDESHLEILLNQKFRKKIREGKYELVFARNGFDALKKMKGADDFDLVITDINMPEMDGFTLLSEIHQKYPTLQTMVMSAYGDEKSRNTAKASGASKFITKPIKLSELEETLDQVCEQKED